MRPNLFDLTLSELETRLKAIGQPAYRARQVFKWLYQGLVSSFDEMTDLPLPLRALLSAELTLAGLKPITEAVSEDNHTAKVLFGLKDGKSVESVLMLYDEAGEGRLRNTVCLSSQVGCPMACPFCATGRQGFERNLTAGEIVAQVVFFQQRLRKDGGAKYGQAAQPGVTNVVFMGMGEPLANYGAVMRAIEIMTGKEGLGFSPRRITISTSGLVPQIKRLAGEESPVELAVSLHAPDNELRNRLVPANRRFPIEALMSAVGEWFEKTGRRPTFEYTLFKDLNDGRAQARQLAALLRGRNCHVNLIPANPTDNCEFTASSPERVARFKHELNVAGVSNTVRRSRGVSIGAACGQLRSLRQATGR